MNEFKDQMNRTILLESTPRRIVSLVPSQTELLYHLGLENEVVGITKFCIHPQSWHQSKTRVGGTKNVDFKKIKVLNPDLIIGNKEENYQADIEQLEQSFPVWMSDIYTLDDALNMIKQVGEITQKQKAAKAIIDQIQSNFNQIQPLEKVKSVLYLIWKDPYISVGSNTFIDHILKRLGFVNIEKNDRYPEVDLTLIEQPDYILLSSEPYPFKKKHIDEIQVKFPASKIVLVDGEYFSWYGSRLLNAPKYFNELISTLKDFS